uniref:Uncharacterized protein n=2 Tax=Physcomitrium patens TaxID=3218 RepID=A0A2K1IXT4_PHYPA|nr:hypothetical protein PHYPA_023892 [Physcomitrium patens]
MELTTHMSTPSWNMPFSLYTLILSLYLSISLSFLSLSPLFLLHSLAISMLWAGTCSSLMEHVKSPHFIHLLNLFDCVFIYGYCKSWFFILFLYSICVFFNSVSRVCELVYSVMEPSSGLGF